eukprot:CAMPEP_0204917886 /NCGR_PEP_ID=MMETSP1397-20131031/15600_1 /ASSEMBLY_ACC=CAM_ASM_000891 /TAXON_ID=49980 /ORGANISM="Climacostomum Climacostomum virens, Strain Stock W-24" /LENGTH=192 /DNA_ID=CAMNT_0052090893 /DNA_START=1 /DNA_END=576 /DNA_ORIENTATION=+
MEEDKAAYIEECHKLSVKPNSAILRALSDEDGFIIDRFSPHDNYLGDRGMLPLLPILRDKSRLKIIELPKQGLKSNFAIKFAQDFAFHPCLQKVNLEANLIGNKGGEALLSMVERNENIEQLMLNDNLIYYKILKKIEQEIESRKRVTNRSQATFEEWAKTQYSLGESSSIVPFFTMTPDPFRSGLTTPAGS